MALNAVRNEPRQNIGRKAMFWDRGTRKKKKRRMIMEVGAQ